MPVQTQTSNLLQRFGGRIAQANAEHKDKPLDLGFKRLPPGINTGIGKLHTVAMKQYGQDEKILALRGMDYLHVVGVVLSPQSHNGEKVEGAQMFQRFPLCDIPANPNNVYSKPRSFSDNWYEFTQFFLRFGIVPPNETAQTDPTGQKTLGYYLAAIPALMSRPEKDRCYSFKTRAWRPQGAKEDRIEEEWGKQCEWNGQHDPAAAVTESPEAVQPGPFTAPPTDNGAPAFRSAPTAPAHPSAPITTDPADEVASLVEVAMNDPEGATDEGFQAAHRLQEMAWAAGWTKEQTAGAQDWTHVGEMALNPPNNLFTAPSGVAYPTAPTVGSKWKFAKRTKEGLKLKNSKGEEFPPQEVEVTTTDAAARTCTVKALKDGKDVVDIKTKKPIAVKFEWLEAIAY
jgi:hypothetical protein